MDAIEIGPAKSNTGDALNLPRPHRSVGSQTFANRLTPDCYPPPLPCPPSAPPLPCPPSYCTPPPSDTCAEFPWVYHRSLSKSLILKSGLLRLNNSTSSALIRLYSLADRWRDFSNSR